MHFPALRPTTGALASNAPFIQQSPHLPHFLFLFPCTRHPAPSCAFCPLSCPSYYLSPPPCPSIYFPVHLPIYLSTTHLPVSSPHFLSIVHRSPSLCPSLSCFFPSMSWSPLLSRTWAGLGRYIEDRERELPRAPLLTEYQALPRTDWYVTKISHRRTRTEALQASLQWHDAGGRGEGSRPEVGGAGMGAGPAQNPLLLFCKYAGPEPSPCVSSGAGLPQDVPVSQVWSRAPALPPPHLPPE